MRKVTVDRGESGPRWPSPCIAEDRNGFTVFHLPGFAVPKIALVSSLLSPKCASAQPSFPLCSHPRRRAPPPVTTHSANALNTQHSHISPLPPAPRNCSFLFAAKRPVAGHLISPVPLLGHRHGRCHEGQSSRKLLRSRPLSQASPRLQVAFPDSLQANIGTS